MNRLLILTISYVLLIFNFAESVNEQQLRDFFVEYNTRNTSEQGLERLPYAIEKGYVDIASFFVRHGDAIGSYTLVFPVEMNKINYFSGCENYPNYYLKNSLITAIRKGYNELAIEMLQMGADIHKAYERKRVLRKDAHTNNVVEVDFKSFLYVYMTEGKDDLNLLTAFLTYGLGVNEQIEFSGSGVFDRYRYKTTPLTLAITSRRLENARMLLDKGSSVDVTGQGYYKPTNGYIEHNPLFFAVLDNYIEGVTLLLEFGADPLFNRNPKSPLELALELSYEDIANLLISAACTETKIENSHN